MKTKEEKLAYIAAFIDGEGHIGHHKCSKGHYSRSIGFCNTDKSLVIFMVKILNECGFSTRVTFNKPKNKNWNIRWTVYISGGKESFVLFRETVPIQSKRKIKTLKIMIDSYCDMKVVHAKKRNGSERKCEVCSKDFYSSKVFIERNEARFCSVKCRGISQRKRYPKNCETCGVLMETCDHNKERKRFCSLSCFGKSKSERMAGMAKMAAAARWAHKNPSV